MKPTRQIAHELSVLEKALRQNISLGKHPAYVKAEFVRIEDEIHKLTLNLFDNADNETNP